VFVRSNGETFERVSQRREGESLSAAGADDRGLKPVMKLRNQEVVDNVGIAQYTRARYS